MTTVTPRDEQDACAAVAEAASGRIPLAIAGGGTKVSIGRPAQTERTLSASGLSGVTLYEPAELVIGARAGTPLSEVERVLAGRGQQLTFEPLDYRPLLGSGGEPTIGGVAAANLSGPRRIQAGAARDSLIGVRFVNGRGELVKNGGRVMKNVTGLDLVKLMAGSWGTLGFLTEVTFKVLPKPERTRTLILRGLDEPGAAAAMAAALGSPYEVTAAAHLPAGLGGGAQTLIRLEGFAYSVDYRSGELRRLFRRYDLDLVDGEANLSLWRSVRDVAPFAADVSDEAVWRVSTAPTKGHVFTAQVARSVPCRWFYDWGGGLVWLACSPKEDAGAAVIRAALAETGGHATLIRAPAEVRAAVEVFQPLSEPLRRLTAGIKGSLDPVGIFSPGRMYAGI
ncbi:glycolate oxidase subunit GlcE [Enterovirga aerilata]|uniref:Glycolate oxidase subunit GlcE n=1 Tax=Enterovirga aerilata TaxID=2730920 RepID=A0A849IA66_9HYPH|nr:glycolate oxidase subunit GlcE [Enterovirga sp. DB1703]NNM73165.1 glycolate oxidase subunit GlcE [Enterovirga sp. DB1703]